MRLALSWLTVLPFHTNKVDRSAARTAIAVAPVVGLLLGLAAAGLLYAAHKAGMPPLLAGLVTVGFMALATRGMHLDGLADTADGLGCYGPPERALAVMKDGGAGPFAVVTLIVVLGAQAAAFAALTPERWLAVVLAITAGRTAFAACCLKGLKPARPEGLGALVAATQPWWIPATWLALLTAAATQAIPNNYWLAPTAIAIAATTATLLIRHTIKRFGGITGDTLGATCELTTTIVLITTTLAQ
ncbi:cobalamin-5'-phosphate synthase [Actinokineospora alba]|uniref:Adenosylcobinamide-GDP ribazoletransferase n=1 Tax=Actinokineospora alba TaxID=504798 RepID=A0A1H0JQP3_9PSEU|nr:adenosylcobinamide-GDP ribazoletransferase [Actinokineospora alba]TDP68201.1 cobalamin-5'-phosphate synthase [Actinokineospora alba]SDH94209.1 adenosylcobinamide-GDP ribazoletransferase [Actinokineospora alba]SDO46058.1 cobalamin-5'-phosphate synthase [Actinokineospora alba]